MMTSPHFRGVFALALVAGLVSGVGLAPSLRAAQEPGASVTIDNFTFAPADLKVPVGTLVTWVNHDDIPHSVVATDKTFRSQALDTDDAYSFTFTTAGTFDYFCGLHPHMTGKVIVTP
jgi:amicyanin